MVYARVFTLAVLLLCLNGIVQHIEPFLRLLYRYVTPCLNSSLAESVSNVDGMNCPLDGIYCQINPFL